MKKQSLTKLTALVLLLTMISLVVISGTFAKYTEQYTLKGSAIVAKWDVTMKDLADGEITRETKFDLFKASEVYDLDGATSATDLSTINPVQENDVAIGTDTAAIVAPGTWGKVGFKISIAATNDVKVKYGVTITEITNTITPLEFSVDGKTWVTSDQISTLTTSREVSKSTEKEDTFILYWRWLYENGTDETLAANDANDLTLGTAETLPTCVLKATFGATQVD